MPHGAVGDSSEYLCFARNIDKLGEKGQDGVCGHVTCEGHVQVGSGVGGVVIFGLEKEVSGV